MALEKETQVLPDLAARFVPNGMGSGEDDVFFDDDTAGIADIADDLAIPAIRPVIGVEDVHNVGIAAQQARRLGIGRPLPLVFSDGVTQRDDTLLVLNDGYGNGDRRIPSTDSGAGNNVVTGRKIGGDAGREIAWFTQQTPGGIGDLGRLN